MTINKSQTITNKYDLEERTLNFSKEVIRFCKKLPKETVNFKLIDQLIRSSTSVGANYREANDSLGKRDFIHRLKIARKEAKETIYWLELILENNLGQNKQVGQLINEAIELRNILSAIIIKATNK